MLAQSSIPNIRHSGRNLVVATLIFVPTIASAFSTSALSFVGANNFHTPFLSFDSAFSDGAVAFAHGSRSFSGLDRMGNNQTMSFTGSTTSSAAFGRLRVKTEGSLRNSYYNENNPDFVGPQGNILHEDGSPSTLTSLGFAIFEDTLQFGGSLQAGYRARYIFRYDGTNSGVGTVADLAFDVEGLGSNSFFAFDQGYNQGIWATDSFEVNGITPQKIRAQFSNQVVFDLFDLKDGSNLDSISDFSSTAVLDHIEVLDANGKLVSGVTVTSDSGTNYVVNPVPEPATTSLVLGVVGLYRKRRAKAKANVTE